MLIITLNFQLETFFVRDRDTAEGTVACHAALAASYVRQVLDKVGVADAKVDLRRLLTTEEGVLERDRAF